MRINNKIYFFSFLFLYPLILLVILILLFQSGILHTLKRDLYIKKDQFIFDNFSSIDQLKLEIKKKDLLTLNFSAQKAVDEYSLKFVDNPYYKARILYNEKYIPIRIRLKGATADEHLNTKKKSFRVKVLGENNILGMTEFSLMDPERRNYLYEWIIRKIFYNEGLITKKYEFIQLRVNEENLGLYVIDEKASKLAVERNLNREGVLVRFNDDAFWFDKIAYKVLGNNQSDTWQDYYYSSPIEALNQKKIDTNPTLLEQFKIARDKLEKFRSNKVLASQVFNIDKMAKFYAIASLLGGQHGALIFNMDFYYNPITSLLEPIPDDSYSEAHFFLGRVKTHDYKYWHDDFSRQLFNDEKFFKLYINNIERLSNPSYFKSFLKNHTEEIKNLEGVFNFFYPGFPNIEKLINGEIEALVNNIKEAHDPHLLIRVLPKNIENSIVTLDISLAHNNFPIEILGLELDGKIVADSKKNIIRPERTLFAKPKLYEELILYTKLGFPEKNNIKDDTKFYLVHRILGSNKTKKTELKLSKNYLADNKLDKEFSTNKLYQYDYIIIDEKNIINFKDQDVRIKNDLLIPKGYTLSVRPGTNITLLNGSSIISYSNIELDGNQDSPIVIKSSSIKNTSNNNNSLMHGGIYILNSKKKSRINYAEFNNLGNNYNGYNQFTGSITFYNTNVTILNSKFVNNNSEDNLNIIKSNFNIGNSFFENSLSDAIDIDFSNGKIINTKIANSLNDGLDFSGSHVNLKKIFISKSGDKGISIGEKSFIDGEDITINNSNIGIATKDSSNAEILRAIVENNEIGVAAYNKKKEFSGGKIHLIKSLVQNNKENFINEENSDIIYKKQ